MAERYVLDSCALMAFLEDEPGSQVVEDLIISDSCEVSMSQINLGEVLYLVERKSGPDAAATLEARIYDTPRIELPEANWPRVKQAAKLKAKGRISYADCFAAALTAELDATLVTSDPDFKRLENEGVIKVLWLGHTPDPTKS